MEEKVVQRRAVQETFAWDMLQVLPSIPSCDTQRGVKLALKDSSLLCGAK
jgi:hypothetical protein